ncbi:RagB/SusD family nutrient uptake outer membrane protein [Pedobacter sp. ASV28]|uniref:RagB/SusD family nutrient uptake outer membrane protein n=1 Tax=Pedobacter sp. ASV28 TaxID=2795123 RepID=UPI0018ED8EDA|nr:RagB/SusD family nutrient uptake outer membrane protein [Pedobacter sp. ASV28]
MKKLKYYNIYINKGIAAAFLILYLGGCKKFIEVDEIKTQLLSSQVFDNNASANAATLGMYRQTRAGGLINAITIYNPIISDEIKPYAGIGNNYTNNTLQPSDTTLPWAVIYTVIYTANNVIEGLSNSTGVTEPVRSYYIGEAKLIRAFCHFYLVNLYGDVPLVLNTNVQVNSSIARTPAAMVYAQIITDLKEAQAVLGNDYSFTGGERSRANKWVATALLARAYLYQKDYANAEIQANAVITSGQYSLLNGPTGIFVKNNNEAIWQFANNATEANTVAANFIYTTTPTYVATSFLTNAFETGDARKTTWLRTQTISGVLVSTPLKFTSTAVTSTEWYTVMRLAEMYLIRAECKSMRNDFQGCIDDVNLIRLKHGNLTVPLPAPANQTAAMDVVMRERQVDLFTEGMHRWFDLKRTGRLEAVMLAEKPTTWQSYAALYPILFTDIQRNPNLKQNPGYE